jgi:hypothetical protein
MKIVAFRLCVLLRVWECGYAVFGFGQGQGRSSVDRQVDANYEHSRMKKNGGRREDASVREDRPHDRH